uniref:Uncharacterized protein n=1 Tax=viral metagenome TaxID=1070528 RepID=A0A2V0RBG8_9ZZZZ
MPKREAPDMPTGCLSIDEKIEVIDACTILIRNEGAIVAQINIKHGDDGKPSIFMMNVNAPWDNPHKDVSIIYSRIMSDKPAPQPTLSDNFSPCNEMLTIASESEKTDSKRAKSVSFEDMTFESAKKALPQIDTTPSYTDSDTESIQSKTFDQLEGELHDDGPLSGMQMTTCGKKYYLKIKNDGGMLIDMKDVYKYRPSLGGPKKAMRRNIYVMRKTPKNEDESYTITMSVKKPKDAIHVKSIPRGVEVWMRGPTRLETPIQLLENSTLEEVRNMLVNLLCQ